MRRLATILLGLGALLAAPDGRAQFTTGTAPLWSANPPQFGTATTERGLGYGRVGGNERVYVASRQGGTFVYVFNADTGAFQATAGAGAGSLDVTGISGGTNAINDVDVTTDGVVIVCNLTTNATTSAFKCYRWTSEAAAPQTVISYTGGAYRLGDKVTVTGSTADNSATVWAVAASGNRLIRFTTADNGASFTPTEYTFTGLNSGTTPAAYPDPLNANRVWINGNGIPPRLYQYDPATPATAGTLVASVPTTVVPNGSNALVAFATADSSYIATFVYEGTTATSPTYARIANVTAGPAAATLWGQTPTLTGLSSGGNGDVDVRADAPNAYTIFVLSSNNGMNAVTTQKAGLPVELVSFTGVADGATARLRWATASETNNAAFHVERLAAGAWTDVARVAGHGTTAERQQYAHDVAGLTPGAHRFRLRQVDLDGTAHLSNEVEVVVGAGANRVAVTGANPFRSGTALALTVATPQAVRVEVYDALGRRVATPFAGRVETTAAVALDGAGLPAGLYVVRAVGETFHAAVPVTKAD